MDMTFGMVMLGTLIAAGAMIQDLKYRKITNRYLLVCLAAVICFRIIMTARTVRLTRMWLPDDPVIAEILRKSAGIQIPAGWKIVLLAIRDAVFGGIIPGLLLGWLYYFRMIGGADIKLLMVLGILTGARNSFACVWRTALFGAVISVGIIAAYRSGSERLQYRKIFANRRAGSIQRDRELDQRSQSSSECAGTDGSPVTGNMKYVDSGGGTRPFRT